MTTTTSTSNKLWLTAVAGAVIAITAIALTLNGSFREESVGAQSETAAGAGDVLEIPDGIAGGDIPLPRPTLQIHVPGLGSFTLPSQLGVDLVGGATLTPLVIRLSDGTVLTLPYESGVDLAGGETNVWMPYRIHIPGFGSLTLPHELGVDLAGGDTGVGSS